MNLNDDLEKEYDISKCLFGFYGEKIFKEDNSYKNNMI